jgi:hypothetical protein
MSQIGACCQPENAGQDLVTANLPFPSLDFEAFAKKIGAPTGKISHGKGRRGDLSAISRAALVEIFR